MARYMCKTRARYRRLMMAGVCIGLHMVLLRMTWQGEHNSSQHSDLLMSVYVLRSVMRDIYWPAALVHNVSVS